MAVVLKTSEELERMRIAGRLAGEVLDFITPYVKPGVTTGKLNDLCHDYMVRVQGTIPAPLNYAPPGYKPFPKSICTSVNHQVCHGIPGDRVLKPADILNIDITVIKDGFHGDSSRMFYVGEPSIQARRLVEITHECMWLGIKQVRPGARLGDIGRQKWTILGEIAKADPKALGLTGVMPAVTPETAWRHELDHWLRDLDDDELEPQPVTRAAIRWMSPSLRAASTTTWPNLSARVTKSPSGSITACCTMAALCSRRRRRR